MHTYINTCMIYIYNYVIIYVCVYFYIYVYRLADGFARHSEGIMTNCVMAIDGLAVRVRQPFKSEVDNIKTWCCRKGGFALIVMAGCDINGRFLMATANHSGSTNDCIVWQTSRLCNAINEGKLNKKYYIIGDEAFSNTDQILSPWSGSGLGAWRDSFNYWLSHSRQCIERAFGMLCRRFGIFWRKCSFSQPRWSLVIMVCMKLHNLCLDRNIDVPNRRHYEDCEPGDSTEVWDNNDIFEDKANQSRGLEGRRTDITNHLQNQDVRRPIHAACNSRAEKKRS